MTGGSSMKAVTTKEDTAAAANGEPSEATSGGSTMADSAFGVSTVTVSTSTTSS
ncbi:hypothetical protein Pyn_07769 [Prunus yedoensis var. nudiflora]|uniref:Uncharacterized protein n=1 Tax=Prunus yedoensis var. nudiflora TaxID=2094558 RepID=A0A314ULJ6_PRUYE|nr:hypothetical protein Pyn_07769 [Prunus yedoensis var. nudiflora]